MKRIIPLFLLLALLLASCAPAAEPGSSNVPYKPDTANPEPSVADPEPAKTDADSPADNSETREERLTRLYEEFLSAPVIVPKDYNPAIVHDDPAPETADGYFFGCRNANLYLPAYSEYSYIFYIISQKPIIFYYPSTSCI